MKLVSLCSENDLAKLIALHVAPCECINCNGYFLHWQSTRGLWHLCVEGGHMMDGFQIIERYLHFASTQKGCPRITKQIYSEKMHITTATSSISAFMISDQEMESLSKK